MSSCCFKARPTGFSYVNDGDEASATRRIKFRRLFACAVRLTPFLGSCCKAHKYIYIFSFFKKGLYNFTMISIRMAPFHKIEAAQEI